MYVAISISMPTCRSCKSCSTLEKSCSNTDQRKEAQTVLSNPRRPLLRTHKAAHLDCSCVMFGSVSGLHYPSLWFYLSLCSCRDRSFSCRRAVCVCRSVCRLKEKKPRATLQSVIVLVCGYLVMILICMFFFSQPRTQQFSSSNRNRRRFIVLPLVNADTSARWLSRVTQSYFECHWVVACTGSEVCVGVDKLFETKNVLKNRLVEIPASGQFSSDL